MFTFALVALNARTDKNKRTSVIPLSRTDFVAQETLKLKSRTVKLHNSFIPYSLTHYL